MFGIRFFLRIHIAETIWNLTPTGNIVNEKKKGERSRLQLLCKQSRTKFAAAGSGKGSRFVVAPPRPTSVPLSPANSLARRPARSTDQPRSTRRRQWRRWRATTAARRRGGSGAAPCRSRSTSTTPTSPRCPRPRPSW